MLFNSYVFIFIFLPLTLFTVFLANRYKKINTSAFILIIASLFFYGWWNPPYLILLLGSIIFNFFIAQVIQKNKLILLLGLTFNLGLIAYFKYANFFIDNINVLFNQSIYLENIILPLAISFFTFQQISYLVDAYRGNADKYSFLHYFLFVTFFPQLIAGPIVHHKEIIPQFSHKNFLKFRSNYVFIGLSLFSLGLFKKIIFADTMAIYASAAFAAAENGAILTIYEAWLGSLAYTMQLYFDFSGYSDMALGLAIMFGFKLPVNFFSPYKATNIADFWRRWHITLSRMIREYLWDPISLAMTRLAVRSRYGVIRFFIVTSVAPTLFTFFWIGLWHGAGWNFIVFGMLHGSYITTYNLWSQLKQKYKYLKIITNKAIANILARFITFISVVIGWIFFRAESFSSATSILSSMFGLNKISIPQSAISFSGISREWLINNGFIIEGLFSNGVMGNQPVNVIIYTVALIIFCYVMPNCTQIFQRHRPFISTYPDQPIPSKNFSYLKWAPTYKWAIFIAFIFSISVMNILYESEFLYFQF